MRALDRPSDQLGVEHHIECIDAKMPFGLIVPTIYLNDVAEALEGVEGESDRENERESADGILPVHQLRKCRNICIEEIKIFKYKNDC